MIPFVMGLISPRGPRVDWVHDESANFSNFPPRKKVEVIDNLIPARETRTIRIVRKSSWSPGSMFVPKTIGPNFIITAIRVGSVTLDIGDPIPCEWFETECSLYFLPKTIERDQPVEIDIENSSFAHSLFRGVLCGVDL